MSREPILIDCVEIIRKDVYKCVSPAVIENTSKARPSCRGEGRKRERQRKEKKMAKSVVTVLDTAVDSIHTAVNPISPTVDSRDSDSSVDFPVDRPDYFNTQFIVPLARRSDHLAAMEVHQLRRGVVDATRISSDPEILVMVSLQEKVSI
ncbi:MAG: hypothetical protein M1816_003711 [Peltula sp. TS41687]|nr:MAG: hypothetical protein M1816_003711 [Peltula sp. TS41687]